MSATFVVHQHHHFGWTTNARAASTPEEALIADIKSYHQWLDEYPHRIEFIAGERPLYAVYYEGETRKLPFGLTQFKGDYWFGDRIRVGQPDDCGACGGTGRNHYYSWRQCWKCGDGKTDGQSSGKKSEAA